MREKKYLTKTERVIFRFLNRKNHFRTFKTHGSENDAVSEKYPQGKSFSMRESFASGMPVAKRGIMVECCRISNELQGKVNNK